MSIKWDKSLETGVELIDRQHMEFISRLNSVSEAMLQGRGSEEVSNTVRFLEDYVKTHFEAEENLMAGSVYPAFFEHRKMHAVFAEMTEKIKAAVSEQDFKYGSAVGIHKAMSTWIVNHIKSEDSKIGKYLRSKGEKK